MLCKLKHCLSTTLVKNILMMSRVKSCEQRHIIKEHINSSALYSSALVIKLSALVIKLFKNVFYCEMNLTRLHDVLLPRLRSSKYY